MLVKVKSYVAFSFHSVCTGGLGNYKMSVKRMQVNILLARNVIAFSPDFSPVTEAQVWHLLF